LPLSRVGDGGGILAQVLRDETARLIAALPARIGGGKP